MNVKNKVSDIYANKTTRIRGFVADRLKQKSVLNCDLFKDDDTNYKKKISTMLDKLNQVLSNRTRSLV